MEPTEPASERIGVGNNTAWTRAHDDDDDDESQLLMRRATRMKE
jgi:hypothetical protein